MRNSMIKLMKSIVAALAVAGIATVTTPAAHAAGDTPKPPRQHWSFSVCSAPSIGPRRSVAFRSTAKYARNAIHWSWCISAI